MSQTVSYFRKFGPAPEFTRIAMLHTASTIAGLQRRNPKKAKFYALSYFSLRLRASRQVRQGDGASDSACHIHGRQQTCVLKLSLSRKSKEGKSYARALLRGWFLKDFPFSSVCQQTSGKDQLTENKNRHSGPIGARRAPRLHEYSTSILS